MSTEELDQSIVEEFAGRFFDILNSSAQALFISMGLKTGLIATMVALPSSTSKQIAEAAVLDERYVREWLAGMVVSRIVDYDAVDQTYTLPAEHGAVLSGADETHMAGHAQFIPALAAIEPAVIEHFRHGGGLPYSAYNDLDWGVPVGEPESDTEFLNVILPLAPGLVGRLESGIDVAEIGCGWGHTLNVMADAFPQSRFTGYDFSPEGIAGAQKEAAALGLSNVSFELQDVAELDRRDTFDLVLANDAIHDQAKPRTVLAAINAALRPGGTFLMADVRASSKLEDNVTHPLGPYLYMWSLLHCMTVSLAQGGEGLGAMWGEQKAVQYLTEAGFRDVVIESPQQDSVNDYYVCTRRQ
jgi:2-polyprenyl-3-methyl-5-hydroxy-6-metoxy-1,4-benzoquinol methylase